MDLFKREEEEGGSGLSLKPESRGTREGFFPQHILKSPLSLHLETATHEARGFLES